MGAMRGANPLPAVSHKEQEKQEERVPPNFAALSGLHEKMVSRVEVEMQRRSRVGRVDRVEATIRRHPNHIQWIFYRRVRPFSHFGLNFYCAKRHFLTSSDVSSPFPKKPKRLRNNLCALLYVSRYAFSSLHLEATQLLKAKTLSGIEDRNSME